MTDKNITIKGLVSFDTTAAQRSLGEISKSFSKIDKTSFNKLNDDFRKISSTIKGLDKDALKFMDRLAKKDAKDQIKSINIVLKEQTQFLKDAVRQQEALADAIERTSDAKKKDALIKQREDSISTAQKAMGNIAQATKTRDELQGNKSNNQNTNNVLGVVQRAATIGAVTYAVKEIVSHFSGADYRKMGYEGQAQSAPNKIANLLYSKSMDYGILAAHGGLGRAIKAGEDVQSGTVANRAVGALGTTAQGAVGGAAMGGGLGAAIGGFFGFGKALIDNKDFIDPRLHSSVIAAEKSAITSESIENLRAKHAFAIDLANERLGLAPAKQAAAQAFSGYGSNASLARKVSNAMSAGWKYGYSIPESASMAQMNSAAGLIGPERTNISNMALFERAGLSSAGETANLTGRTANIANDQQKIMKMFEQAMQKGVQTGIEKSLVKDLVASATSIAEGGTARIDSLDSIMKDLRVSLGTMHNNEIGRADINEAQSAVSRFRSMKGGANNPMGLAIQTLGMQEGLNASGIDIGKMPTSAVMLLSQARSVDEVKSNPALMQALDEAAGGNRKAVNNFLNNEFESAKTFGVINQTGGITDISEINSKEKINNYRAGTKKGATPEQMQNTMRIYNKRVLDLQAIHGITAQEAQKMAGLELGQELLTDPKATIENTLQTTTALQDKKFEATIERNREGLRSKKDFVKEISDAQAAAMHDAGQFAGKDSKNIFEPGGSMVVSMGSLEDAIKQLTAVLMAKGKIPDTREPYTVQPAPRLEEGNPFISYPEGSSVKGQY